MSHAPQGVEVLVGERGLFLWWTFAPFWTGRAFPINATCMVTCDHVVKSAKPKNFRFPAHPNLPPVKKIIYIDGSHDIDMAIIVFAAPHGLTPVTLAAQNPAVGTPIAFTNQHGFYREGTVHGYFSYADTLQAIVDAGIMPNTSAKLRRVMREASRKNLLCNLHVKNGDSGSPAYNEQGEVVGMVFAISKITDQAMLVPVEDLRKHIDEQLADLSYTLAC